jgi:hypothetical protein
MSHTFTNKQLFGKLHEEGNSEGAVKGWKTRHGSDSHKSQIDRDFLAGGIKIGRKYAKSEPKAALGVQAAKNSLKRFGQTKAANRYVQTLVLKQQKKARRRSSFYSSPSRGSAALQISQRKRWEGSDYHGA